MVDKVVGPTQMHTYDWRLDYHLLSYTDEIIPKIHRCVLSLWIKEGLMLPPPLKFYIS